MTRPAVDLVALVEGQERFEAATTVVVAGTLAESTNVDGQVAKAVNEN